MSTLAEENSLWAPSQRAQPCAAQLQATARQGPDRSRPMRFPLRAYVLSVSADRGELLMRTASEHWEWPVSEPIPKIPHPGREPILVFASFEEDNVTHVAEGKLGSRAGTGMVQLWLHDLDALTRPFPFSEIETRVPVRVRSHLRRYLRGGGSLPAKTRDAFVAFMAEADPTVAGLMGRLETDARTVVEHLPARARENLALQKDTAGVALRIGGIEPQQLARWGLRDHTPRSFLEGLPEARVREDAMILTDFSTIPGLAEVRSATHYAAHTFQGRRDPSNRVTIIMANRQPLEQQTGADLIYFNEKYRSFVMVQYKAMEQEGGEARFRWNAGDQFTEELARMDLLWKEITKTNTGAGPPAFRFSNNPFFLKFCSRVVFDPGSAGMFKGMYVPLDLWHILSRSGRLKGPRGGNAVTFANVGRAMNNTEFINLLSKSWVGTSADQSDYLESLIREVLKTGKTVTLAVKREG